MKPNASDRDSNTGSDFEELEPNRIALCCFQLSSLEVLTTQGIDQHVGECRKQQSKLIRLEVVTARAIGEQHQLLFLDAVLHIASHRVNFVI